MTSQIFVSTQRKILLVQVCVGIMVSCAGLERQNKPAARAHHSESRDGEAEIQQSWPGDYLVTQLNLLPEGQREQPVGFINDAKTFEGVWKGLRPGEDVPEIDFKTSIVLFARNTQFYNRISIGKVNLKGGVAEVLAMETMSAMPIGDKVAMSLVEVRRKGIRAIQTGDNIIPINKKVSKVSETFSGDRSGARIVSCT